ncbi:leucine--tRNA ligase [Patescibacteria group bacterium]|nr:leucine--tRNA ligase [Patescibacteria group bacterium]
MDKYDHTKVEKKWQEKWKQEKMNQPDMDNAKKPYFNLMMFPYLSAEGLHVGNMYAFTGSDIWGRYQRMKGFDVFEPMGLDGFGIHSENYAIKIGEHIGEVSKRTEKHFYEQLRMTGNQFDWSRTVETYKPEYYKWTQWLFVQMFKNGLAYRKKATVNWCPSCKTVLSDEQVENGVCERCKSETTTKEMKQWFWRITDYAERLNKNLEWINWSEEVKIGQRNWIGRSEGVNFKHKVKDLDIEFEVYDSIPQTHMAQTFFIVAPEHAIVEKLVAGTDKEEDVLSFVERIKKKKLSHRFDIDKDMEGVFTGRYVENYLGSGKDLPIWIASFVFVDYGTGIIGCSAHDERDFKFAKKYEIPLKPVLFPKDKKLAEKVRKLEVFYREPDGILEEPKEFNGVRWDEARGPIIEYIEKKGIGKRAVNYKLRDWCISRQRYWGDPIPMIQCKKCEWQPVPEEDFPVLLPEIRELKDILPDGSGKGPLAKQENFVKTKCPKCGGEAKRETDVMDPFVDSSWYFLRYPSTDMGNVPFDKKRTKKWLPVDMYIGGKEHTVLHLLYSRFITMALKDWEYIDFEEPYERFFGHGLLIKGGAKMSKSKGNVINPDEYIGKYGADAVRMYLMFLGGFEQGGDWRDTVMMGMHKFIQRVWKLLERKGEEGTGIAVRSMIHKTVFKVERDIERLSYNTAIAKIMEFVNWYRENEDDFKKDERREVFKTLSLLLAPIAPHIAEEIWSQLGSDFSVHQQTWPEYDKNLIMEEEVEIAVQINGKLRDTIKGQFGMSQEDVERLARVSVKVQKHLTKKVKRVIFVENKIISFVV